MADKKKSKQVLKELEPSPFDPSEYKMNPETGDYEHPSISDGKPMTPASLKRLDEASLENRDKAEKGLPMTYAPDVREKLVNSLTNPGGGTRRLDDAKRGYGTEEQSFDDGNGGIATGEGKSPTANTIDDALADRKSFRNSRMAASDIQQELVRLHREVAKLKKGKSGDDESTPPADDQE